MTSDLSGLLALTAVVWVIFLIGGIGFYIWYGIALSKLFPKLGAEGWKGWVPILNEYEILVRGGLPGWQIVFAFLPVVSLYYLYLKFQAATRIGQLVGRPGTGLAVVAPLIAPLWATLVQTGSAAPAAPLGDRVAASMAAPGAPGAAGGLAAPALVAAPGSVPPPPPPAPPAPSAPLGATGFAPAPPVPPAPSVPTASVPAPSVPTASPAAPPAPPAPDPVAAPSAPAADPISPPPAPPALVTPPEPVPATEIPPAVVRNPWAPWVGPHPAPVLEPLAPLAPAEPFAPLTPFAPAAALVAPPPAPVIEAPIAMRPDPAPAAPPPAPAVAAEEPQPELDADADDDEMGATIVVDRRPRVRWRLELDGGAVFALDRATVVLGRKPVTSDAEVQDVAVPDTTRTLSKLHARLERRDEQWVITDLDSTNGVVVVDAAGEEQLLDPGASTTITGRFILGKVGMRLAYNDGTGEWRS